MYCMYTSTVSTLSERGVHRLMNIHNGSRSVTNILYMSVSMSHCHNVFTYICSNLKSSI